jgi:hypothetical protein
MIYLAIGGIAVALSNIMTRFQLSNLIKRVEELERKIKYYEGS